MGKVRYNQRGYVGCSMSRRAVWAYERGEKPKSKWTKRAMLDEIAGYSEMFGIECDVSSMSKAELWERFFEWKGWHHTSKYANETDFYGLDEEALVEWAEGSAA